MSEKLKGGAELEKSAEQLEKVGIEKRAEIEKALEKNAERSTGENLEDARQEALESALSKEDQGKKNQEKNSNERPRPEKPQKIDLEMSYRKTMSHIQKDMSPTSRAFSKVIHTPAVDKISSAVGSTVARPNLILAGAIGMIILGSGIYLVAKTYSYPLSGFEAIGASIVGWCIGALIEFARLGLKGNRQ